MNKVNTAAGSGAEGTGTSAASVDSTGKMSSARLAELRDEFFRLGIGRVRQEIVVDARKNVVEPVKSGMNDQRGGDPIARRHARKNESFFYMLGIPGPCAEAGRLLRRVIEQPAHLLRVQIRRAARRGRRAKYAGNGVRALVAVVPEVDRAKTDGHARPDVVAERDGAQEAGSVDAKFFPSRQGCRNDRAAGMRLRRGV